MSGSTVPQVLPYLTAKFAALAIDGLTVANGPLYDPPGHYLCVGWDRSESPGVEFRPSLSDYALRADQETYDVNCLLAVWLGENDIAAACSAAFDIYNQSAAALADDHTLGDLVMLARMSFGTYTPDVERTGGAVELRFVISIQAVA